MLDTIVDQPMEKAIGGRLGLPATLLPAAYGDALRWARDISSTSVAA